jgi:hypothetical protein
MYRLTATYEIWDDEDGETHVEVGEDSEGLDMVEIRQYAPGEDDETEEIGVVGCTPEEAGQLIEAITSFLNSRVTVTVQDEESGSRLEVGDLILDEGEDEPEEDLVEIRGYDEEGNGVSGIFCTPEQLTYIRNAIHRYLKSRDFLLKNPTGMVDSGAPLN